MWITRTANALSHRRRSEGDPKHCLMPSFHGESSTQTCCVFRRAREPAETTTDTAGRTRVLRLLLVPQCRFVADSTTHLPVPSISIIHTEAQSFTRSPTVPIKESSIRGFRVCLYSTSISTRAFAYTLLLRYNAVCLAFSVLIWKRGQSPPKRSW
jgi:hypothetical protein